MTVKPHSRRGCHCAACSRARAKNTNWRRRRMAKALEAAQLHAGTCPRRQGSGRCGGRLETFVGEGGRTRVRCLGCERRLRGICKDCNAPVEGRVGTAIRCAEHKRIFRNQCTARWAEEHHGEIIAKSRAKIRNRDAATREIQNEKKRAWRKANPDKVRAQKRRYIEKHAKDPNSAYNRYHRKYRKKYRAHAEAHGAKLRELHDANRPKPPKCTECGKSTRWTPVPYVPGKKGNGTKPWKTCNKCCWPHERRQRVATRRRARLELKKWLKEHPKPARVVPPPRAAVRGPGYERLCITPGCETVVTHRKKKCSRCRAKDAAVANQFLEPFRGRGRRTDLERRRGQVAA